MHVNVKLELREMKPIIGCKVGVTCLYDIKDDLDNFTGYEDNLTFEFKL